VTAGRYDVQRDRDRKAQQRNKKENNDEETGKGWPRQSPTETGALIGELASAGRVRAN